MQTMKVALLGVCVTSLVAALSAAGQEPPSESREALEYRVVATVRTSTLEKEINDAAESGYRLRGMIGGSTAFGGAEMVAILTRRAVGEPAHRYEYRVLATNRTSTMQDELQDAGEDGYDFRGQTILETAFGGREVVVVLEREREGPRPIVEYRLLATNRTSTMERELDAIGEEGYEIVGLTVAETFIGGEEGVAITQRVSPGVAPSVDEVTPEDAPPAEEIAPQDVPPTEPAPE